jgi:hypothetical protein
MKLAAIADELTLVNLTPEVLEGPAREIDSGHVSDLLSDVIAHAPDGGVLVTIQVHLNVIAVAVHAGLAAVIFAGGMRPEAAVLERAREEGIVLYASPESAFDLVGRLYLLGLRGRHG